MGLLSDRCRTPHIGAVVAREEALAKLEVFARFVIRGAEDNLGLSLFSWMCGEHV